MFGRELMHPTDRRFLRFLNDAALVTVAAIPLTVTHGGLERIGAVMVDELLAVVVPAQESADALATAIDQEPTPRVDDTPDLDEIEFMDGFSATQAARFVGISYRQLDYWARTDVVSPSGFSEQQQIRRVYSYKDLLVLNVMKTMLDSGARLEEVRSAVGATRDLAPANVDASYLVTDGSGVSVVRGAGLQAHLRRHRTIQAFSVGKVRASLDEQISAMRQGD